jgi:hypothetical protein
LSLFLCQHSLSAGFLLPGIPYHGAVCRAVIMRILFLPPCSPELNPLEHVLKGLESNQGVMRSITGWNWIINAVAELNCNKTAPLHIHIHRLLLLSIKTIQFIPGDLPGFLKSNVSTAYKTQNPAHTIFLNC